VQLIYNTVKVTLNFRRETAVGDPFMQCFKVWSFVFSGLIWGVRRKSAFWERLAGLINLALAHDYFYSIYTVFRKQSQKLRFVGTAILLFTPYKTTWLTTQRSLSRCITCQDVYVQHSHIRQNACYRSLKWTSLIKMRCHVTVTQ